jgi:hypothetical protein
MIKNHKPTMPIYKHKPNKKPKLKKHKKKTMRKISTNNNPMEIISTSI